MVNHSKRPNGSPYEIPLKYLFVDVDNTLVSFQPTAELYKRLFIPKKGLKYYIYGYFMIILLRFFWFLPSIVRYQRALIMSLISTASSSEIEKESSNITKKIIEEYNLEFGALLSKYREPNDKVFLLTHCPKTISEKIVKALGFDGEYSIEIKNYLRTKEKILNFDKNKIIKEFITRYPEAEIYYFADDLVDIRGLIAADQGILVNATSFTKFICVLLNKIIKSNIHV